MKRTHPVGEGQIEWRGRGRQVGVNSSPWFWLMCAVAASWKQFGKVCKTFRRGSQTGSTAPKKLEIKVIQKCHG